MTFLRVQIGYSATTTDLSDKEQFGYFLRVVPSDVWQARAINQLLRQFNWTYIGVIYSAGKQFFRQSTSQRKRWEIVKPLIPIPMTAAQTSVRF